MISDHPQVRAAMERLERDMREAIEPHLIRVEDSVIVLDSMFADAADRLNCRVLDRMQEGGEIAAYDYESVIDPFTRTLHAHVSAVIPVVPERIIVSLRLPDDC